MRSTLSYFRNASRRQWLLLGSAVLGLASSATTLTFFLPLILHKLTDSQLAIGFAVGVEGFIALTIPLVVGQASDRTWTRIGRRLPYMLAASPLVFIGLIAVALAQSYWLIVAAVLVFFLGYYTYYTAYQALYPDTLPPEEYGRAWSYLNIFQGIGVAVALLGGGALVTMNLSAPFIAAAFFFVVVSGITMLGIHERRHRGHVAEAMPLYRALPNFLNRLRRDANLRLFLAAHFFWEFTLAAIRAFVLLYLLQGLGLETGDLMVVLGIVIFTYLMASVVSGHIADAYDPRRYTSGVVLVYAVVMLITGLSTNELLLRGTLPFGMFAGAAVLMLSYPILLRVTPKDRRGEYTGYYQFNRGLALLIGTSTTGFLIDTFGHHFPQTDGYQVLWLTTAAAAFASLPFFLRLTARQRESVGSRVRPS